MVKHYKILGISPGATQQEIRAAYRKLAMQRHPDRSASPEAAAQMQAINQAYDVLGNPECRRHYDAGTGLVLVSYLAGPTATWSAILGRFLALQLGVLGLGSAIAALLIAVIR